ncbi:MAG: DUF6115 domain-containing protein [Clostridium sp.]
MPILLIVVGIILIVLNYIALQKEGKASFKDILNKKNEDITEEKLEVAKVRKEMAEVITELQREIYDLREDLNNSISKGKVKSESYEKESEELSEQEYLLAGDSGVVSNINFNQVKSENNKKDKIRNLIREGFTDEEICVELSIGKGEVLLVRNLYKS